MLRFICLLALASAAVVSAASIGSVDSTTEKREIIPVLRFETDKKPDGSFSFTYEGGDKSFREETGVVENGGTDEETLEVSGSYRYIDADGQEIEVHYTAGKNGFVPVGTNIPSAISDLARAAADLPNSPDDEEQVKRRARSKDEKEDVKKVETKVEKLKKEDKIEKKVPVLVKEEKIEKVENVPVEKKPVEEKKLVEEKKSVEEKKTIEGKKPIEEKKSETKPEPAAKVSTKV